MSVATAFNHFKPFGNDTVCVPDISFFGPSFEDGVLLGPLTLAEVMALHWNLETVTFDGQGNAMVSTNTTAPRDRVCAFAGIAENDFWVGAIIAHDLVVAHNNVFIDGTDYYIPVKADYFTDISSQWFFSLWGGGVGGYTIDHSFSASVLGITMTVYAYRQTAIWGGGADTYSVTAAFYTY